MPGGAMRGGAMRGGATSRRPGVATACRHAGLTSCFAVPAAMGAFAVSATSNPWQIASDLNLLVASSPAPNAQPAFQDI